MWHGRVADCRSCRWGGLRRNRRGLLVRVHGLQPTHRPPRVSDSAESDTPATCDAANPITPGTAPTAESTTPSDAATPAVSAAKSMRPASTAHASRTSTARRRAHVAHDQIIQRHTEHVAKHQQLVTNVAFHATILRLHCDSQIIFATQPTVARREVGFTGLYDNRKTLEIPTIPRVLSGADDGSRTRL